MFKKVFLALILVFGAVTQLQAQDPDCRENFGPTASTGRVKTVDNRIRGCTTWTLVYNSAGYSAVNIQVERAPNTTSSVAGSWTVWTAGSVTLGTFPLTDTTGGTASMGDYWPWVSVNITSATGTGTISGTLYGWRTSAAMAPGSNRVAIDQSNPGVTNKVQITDSFGNAITAVTDPCDGVIPTRVAISQTADTTIISQVSAKTNYICGGLIIVDNSGGATETINIIEGTGAGCVTTQTAAIAGSTTEANGMKITGNGFAINKMLPGSGTNVNTCLMQVGTQRVSGFILYVQP